MRPERTGSKCTREARRVPKMSADRPPVRRSTWFGLRTGRRVGAGHGSGRVHRGRPGEGRRAGRTADRPPSPRRRPMGSPATKAQRSARVYHPPRRSLVARPRRRPFRDPCLSAPEPPNGTDFSPFRPSWDLTPRGVRLAGRDPVGPYRTRTPLGAARPRDFWPFRLVFRKIDADFRPQRLRRNLEKKIPDRFAPDRFVLSDVVF